jgi:ABC-2 type transport system ATP-binding protein
VKTNSTIRTDHLTRHFGEIAAVDGLTLEVHMGEVFGFLGHNGAGKTTTVRLLNGVLAPTGGTARVLDLDPVTDGPALRHRTGVLTETPSLDERLTARENLRIYADLYDVPLEKADSRVEELLEEFELADRADEKAGGYSKGMKQRLALARALLHEPELLFLDEPTAGLDPVAARHVHQLITQQSQRKGHTVFLCTHNLVEAQRLCDRVAVLQYGRVLALGTPGELAHRLGRSQRMEIESDPETAPLALEKLSAFPGISDITLEDASISFVGVNHERVPDVISTLAEAGVRIYRVTPQEPTLEDVYFALHGEEETVS